jgi:hypothetical protein
MNEVITRFEGDPITARLPVTLNQEQVLLSMELARTHHLSHVPQLLPAVLAFTGPLRTSALRDALNGLVTRHPALRTQFYRADVPDAERRARLNAFARTGIFSPGLHCQTLAPASPMALPITDISHLSEQDQILYLRRSFEREAAIAFDAPPRLRANLFLTGPEASVLHLVVDHIISDAWSMGIIKADLLRLYANFQSSNPRAIDPTAVSFLDYAVWEQERIRDGFFNQDAAYWREKWAEYGDARLMPADFPFATRSAPSPVAGFGYAAVPLSEELSAAVKRFACNSRCSVHTALLAAYCILLRQYTGHDKVASWIHFANRLRPETADVVGWFNNTNLIGADMSANVTVESLTAGLRTQLREGVLHQEMPGPLLWHKLRCCPRVADIRPLLDTYMSDDSTALPDGVQVTFCSPPAPAAGRLSQFGVYVDQEPAELTISAQLSLAAFSPETAATVVRDMSNIIEQLVSAPSEQKVGDLRPPRQTPAGVAAMRDEMGEYVLLGSRAIPELETYTHGCGDAAHCGVRRFSELKPNRVNETAVR